MQLGFQYRTLFQEKTTVVLPSIYTFFFLQWRIFKYFDKKPTTKLLPSVHTVKEVTKNSGRNLIEYFFLWIIMLWLLR